MPKKKSVDDVIASGAVKSVKEETPGERMLRQLLEDLRRVSALILIVVGLIAAFLLILTDKMAAQAFTLLNTIVASAIGYFFGRLEK